MISLIGIFVLIIAGLYLGIQLAHDPGYILIALNHWTIEMSLWVALAGLLLLFMLLYGLMKLLNSIIQLPVHIQQWRLRHRLHKAQQTTRRGLIEFSEGYWESAKKDLMKALPDTDLPLLNYLTAARAAQEMGDSQLRDDYLREAQQTVPEAKIAVKLTQAQLQVADHQWEQALATLRHLQDLAPYHPYVLKLLMHLYQEVRDWPNLLLLLPELKKGRVLDKASFAAVRQQAYLQAMTEWARTGNEEALQSLVNSLPRELKRDADIMACYCSFLIKNNQIATAEAILRRGLRDAYQEKLIKLYGFCYSNEKQLSFAEALLKKAQDSAALYLCLGRLSMESKLWGKAKTYLEQSLVLEEDNVETLEALGKLYEQLGENDKARELYRRGLVCQQTSLQNAKSCSI